MQQVLSNLLSNALKFSPEGGEIEIGLRSWHGAGVEFRVSDSGTGILKENLARIFERNWQVRETAHLGAGLGLYIARGIVLAHGGEIRVLSELGRGSTFLVRVPPPSAGAHAAARLS
jgi:signal transduction histidine kinase